jgi:hypothetical protein
MGIPIGKNGTLLKNVTFASVFRTAEAKHTKKAISKKRCFKFLCHFQSVV